MLILPMGLLIVAGFRVVVSPAGRSVAFDSWTNAFSRRIVSTYAAMMREGLRDGDVYHAR